jgi:hypothetical protein
MREETASREAPGTEGAKAFGGFIGPRTLIEQVRIAEPFLFDGSHPLSARIPDTRADALAEHGLHPLGWWSILRQANRLEAAEDPSPRARTDYFALCLAAHFASVASYVPTDVDAKIRRALWFEEQPEDEMARKCALALYLKDWDVRGVSARILDVDGIGPVSGHDGERLSVLAGGMLGLLERGDATAAARFGAEIDAELEREARAFEAVESEPGHEIDLLRLAWILTHNAGDVMQGLSAKGVRLVGERPVGERERTRFADLARERFERYGGAFGRAAVLYRAILAPEGHRNYPLRATKLLRAHPDLLLPLGPCLDDWGARLATWPAWTTAQRAEVLTAILEGCRKVPGQESYFRALAGFDEAHPGGLASRELHAHLASAARRSLADPEILKKARVPRASFERSLAKRARSVLAGGTSSGPHPR